MRFLKSCWNARTTINNDDDSLLNFTVPTAPSLYTRLSGWSQYCVTKIAGTGALGTAVYYNFVRDVAWAYVTAKGLAPDFRKDDNWSEANEAQWLDGTVAMCLAISLHYLACRATQQKMPWANTFISIAAASAAIPAWNYAAKLGLNLGVNTYHYSKTAAGYLAGVFTGLAEGPTQEIINSIGQYITNPEDRQYFKQAPGRYTVDFLKRLTWSATVGAIPGDVWQWVYNAGITKNIGNIPTSIAVAASVATCNIGYDKIKNAGLFSRLCQSYNHAANTQSDSTSMDLTSIQSNP